MEIFKHLKDYSSYWGGGPLAPRHTFLDLLMVIKNIIIIIYYIIINIIIIIYERTVNAPLLVDGHPARRADANAR